MGFRFRKSIKLFPGFKINLTHKGISSASIGKPGASVNIGKKALEPAWAFQEQDSPIPNIDLTQRIPMTHSNLRSHHQHSIQ